MRRSIDPLLKSVQEVKGIPEKANLHVKPKLCIIKIKMHISDSFSTYQVAFNFQHYNVFKVHINVTQKFYAREAGHVYVFIFIYCTCICVKVCTCHGICVEARE